MENFFCTSSISFEKTCAITVHIASCILQSFSRHILRYFYEDIFSILISFRLFFEIWSVNFLNQKWSFHSLIRDVVI